MPIHDLSPSFDNTALAFQYKSDSELKKARFLFKVMSNPWLVQIGTRLTPWSIQAGLPVKGLIRSTLFSQFIGGETLEQTIPVAEKLGSFNVKVILDYGVEGKQGEHFFDQARDEFVRVIDFAATQSNIPFISIKLTGLARFELLEELPGVGHKTASVVMSQAFGFPAFPVDTHIHRLLTRWGISSGKNVVETEKAAKKVFPIETWNKLHLQIIFYGREYSPARGWSLEKDFITRTVLGGKAPKI